jgi:hypothetical protein
MNMDIANVFHSKMHKMREGDGGIILAIKL